MIISNTFFSINGEFKFEYKYGEFNNKPYLKEKEKNNYIFLKHALYSFTSIQEIGKELWIWFGLEGIQLKPENKEDEKEIEKIKQHFEGYKE